MAGPEPLLSVSDISPSSHGRILVADADTGSLSAVCHVLTELGYEAHGVSSAQAAKHALHEQSYDIFLYDRRLTADDETLAFNTVLTGKAQFVAIAMSDPERPRSPQAGIDTAAFEVVPKPIASTILRPVLARAMQVRRLRLENSHLRESVTIHQQGARLYKEAVEATQQVKTDFLATVSHELRTPLDVILGYIGLLQDGEFGPLAAAQQKTLQRVNTNAQRLLDLVSFLLEANRLEAGQLLIDRREVGLLPFFHEIKVETHKTCEQAGLTLDWQTGAAFPPIYTDPDKLRMVLKSLIGNAIKFTEQGTVTVGASIDSDAEGIQIWVADTGIGIPAESLDIIFEPFHQLDGSATRSYEGTGLGLYMAKRLTELLGGAVTLESQVGHGSTFQVWLPLAMD
jgi:signal transduction histidine kinase